MPNHGAEQFLPITALAQWMRDTTGRPEGLVTKKLIFHELPPIELDKPSPFPTVKEVVDLVPPSEAYDKDRMYRAAIEAINSYINEGHTDEEIAEHRKRIWALYEQLIGEKAP